MANRVRESLYPSLPTPPGMRVRTRRFIRHNVVPELAQRFVTPVDHLPAKGNAKKAEVTLIAAGKKAERAVALY